MLVAICRTRAACGAGASLPGVRLLVGGGGGGVDEWHDDSPSAPARLAAAAYRRRPMCMTVPTSEPVVTSRRRFLEGVRVLTVHTMTLYEELLSYALTLPEAWLDHPWGDTVV